MTAEPGRPPLSQRGRHRDVVLAGPADLDVLSHLIAGAFFDLPPSRWLVPEPGARCEIFPPYFRLYLEDALASGTVHTTADRSAVALWLHPAAGLPVPPGQRDDRLAVLAGPRAGRFIAFEEALGQHHPAGTPYHHLAILAVRPGRQGQGLGSGLLDAYHQVMDRDAPAPGCLEAAGLRSRQLYLRHGYTDHGPPIQLPDGPPMYPMMRDRGGRAP